MGDLVDPSGRVEGQTNELPLETLEDNWATFGVSDSYGVYELPCYRMPRPTWVRLGRPLKISVIVRAIPSQEELHA